MLSGVLLLALSACADPGEPDRPASVPLTAEGPAPIAPPTSRAGNTTSTTTTTAPAPTCPNPTAGDDETVEIVATEYRFSPSCVEMSVNQGVEITNEGTVVHNTTLMVVGQDDVEFLGGDLQPGETTATEAFGNQGPGANAYRLFCKYHQDQGMEATLIVR